jgi:mannose-6-phosphate isomerase-like protein (cupin superfamily)
MPVAVWLSMLVTVVLSFLPRIGSAQTVPPLSASRPMPGFPARPEAAPIPPGRQVFYQPEDLIWVDDAPGVSRTTVAGETISFTIVRLHGQTVVRGAPGAESAVLNMEGGMELDNVPFREMEAVILPDGTGSMVQASDDAQLLVFSNTPISLAREGTTPPADTKRKVAAFNQLPWIGELGKAQFKTLSGDGCTLTLYLLPASIMGGTQEPGHHHTMEQITYVLQGHARVRVGDQIRTIGPGTLVMIPSDVDHLPMESLNNEDLLVLDFQPVVRQDLLDRQAQHRASSP